MVVVVASCCVLVCLFCVVGSCLCAGLFVFVVWFCLFVCLFVDGCVRARFCWLLLFV